MNNATLLLSLLLAVLPMTPLSNSYVNIDAAMAMVGAADHDIRPWTSSRNQRDGRNVNNIEVAVEEMQRANYFTFVMLLKMAPPDLMMILEGGNLTFLMPNDKTLSQNSIINLAPGNHTTPSLAHFLLRHSIPSPLLFEYLQHFPTGSTVPTSDPDLVLRITNHGRRSFFLNSVRVSSPNICTRGSSIRCHGIDGVIQANLVPPPPAADHDCRPNDNNNATTSPPPALQAAPPEGDGTRASTATSSTAPPPGEAASKNSAPSLLGLEMPYLGTFEFATKCLALLVLNLIV